MADNESTSVTKDLGIVSAYGYAKAAGYTGTEEEFEQIFLEFTENAPGLLDRLDDAVDAAEAAQTAAESAETAAESAQTAAETAAATFTTDKTLAVSDKAADAKVTGDEITGLKTATTQNTDTISEMLTGFTQGENIASGTLVSGYYSGSGSITASNKYSHLDVNITGATHLLIDGTMGTTSITAWNSLGCFWDENDVRLLPNIPSQTSLPYIVAVPTGAVKLGLNTDYKATDYPSSLPSALKIIPLTPSSNSVVKTNDLSAPTKNIKMLTGIIRNSGSGWGFINDSDHEPLNMSSVEVNESGQIVVNYGFTAKKVLSLIATPDETFAQKYTIGGSVGKDKVTFNVFELAHTIGGAVSYNQSTDTWSITYSTFTNVSFDSTTGKLTLTHETISGIGSAQRYLINADGRNCDVKVNSATDSTIELIFLDSSGNVITTPSADMYMYVTRDINTRLVNATNISDANGNFWIMGVMLV